MKLKPIKNKTELKKALNCIDEEFVQYGHSKHSLDPAYRVFAWSGLFSECLLSDGMVLRN